MSKLPNYLDYWGKADKEDPAIYHLLPYHCMDVAAVGKRLLEKHHMLRRRISLCLNMPEETTVNLLTFFLSIHDIGKFATVFQNFKPDLMERLGQPRCTKQYRVRHDSLGYIAWKCLWPQIVHQGFLGIKPDHPLLNDVEECFDQWVACFAGHHGYPPTIKDGTRRLSANSFFTQEDLDAALQFVKDQWVLHCNFQPDAIADSADEDRAARTSWWLAGFAVLCDWIGSDQSVFAYQGEPEPLDTYWQRYALKCSETAVEKSGLLPAKISQPICLGVFSDRPMEPTPLQAFCESAKINPVPHLWILEDITGSGKTEAALLLASRTMHSQQADGLYIGLPTMATADSMYARMGDYYRHLYQTDQFPSLVLAHGSRHLSERFRNSIVAIQPGQNNLAKKEPTADVQCVQWLADNRKKALLAHVGVGTVDQVLLSILPSRHQSLRLAGLATKLLVVDEVHAYDAYMHTLLKTLLAFHAAIGGSAVLLSATLPYRMRKELIEAFQKGFGGRATAIAPDTAYPLVTKVAGTTVEQTPVQASPRSRRDVPIHFVHDESAVVDALAVAYRRGQCACWVRNTVEDARRAVNLICQDGRVDAGSVMLFHARFTLADRLRIEKGVTVCFGKPSTADDRKAKILIATQVVEQSLDLDFDFLVSDLAPIDLIIQRAGRLRRHIRDAYGNLLVHPGATDLRPKPLMHILAPPIDDPPTSDWYRELFPKAAAVYPHVGRLWLTAATLAEAGRIRMPDDLRHLIESVYAVPIESMPEAFHADSRKAEGDAMGEGSLGAYNSLKHAFGYRVDNGQWAEEAHIPTRLGEVQHTIYLARPDEKSLKPLHSGHFPWDLSSIRIAKRKLTQLSQEWLHQHEQKIEKIRQENKRFAAFDMILPMVPSGNNRWQAEGVDSKGRIVDIQYDPAVGLLVGDEIRGE